jgi:2-dehydropantoate 2-reductase
MKIAIIGPGAIGGLVAGYLKLKNEDVSLVGHYSSVKEIREKGLSISGVRGNFNVKVDIAEKLDFQPEVVILATKTQDIEEALEKNLAFLDNAVILTCQNGVQADKIVCRYLKENNLVSSIVMFGSTSFSAGKLVHNFEGNWIIGRLNDRKDPLVNQLSEITGKIFPTVVTADIRGMKYLKIFVNANNCIPAILGLSMQEVFSDPKVSRISIAIWREGLEVIRKAGINLVSLPDFPLERLMKLISLPEMEAANIYSGIMQGLSKEPLYGSILQSIKRNRLSEIDYLNGEFVVLARDNGMSVPLNERLVKMVHEVEKKKRFFKKEELIKQIKDLIA